MSHSENLFIACTELVEQQKRGNLLVLLLLLYA